MTTGFCAICAKPRPQGCTVTCGKSECQQEAYQRNKERNASKRRRRPHAGGGQ